jgi:16S rRNA (cytosine1402-N4)-methyltransferase
LNEDYHHQPVLAEEVGAFLAPNAGEVFVDATVGGGGHAAAIAERIAPGGVLICIDRDMAAVEATRQRLQSAGAQIILLHENFANLTSVLDELGYKTVNGILFDLGLSSAQVDQAERGFSYRQDAPLDMRADQRQYLTARHLVNEASEEELTRIIQQYGEERWARRIAQRIVARRRDSLIETTVDLAGIIKSAIPANARRGGPHPARRTFQALRIAVNNELEILDQALTSGIGHLAPGGRIAVISFHSLEDRIVKQKFADLAKSCRCPRELATCQCGGPQLKILTKRPIVAGLAEVAANPRARSAKLRAAVRLQK